MALNTPSYTDVTCPCGIVCKKYKPKPGRIYFCSKKCQREAYQRLDGKCLCKQCRNWLDKEEFLWMKDARYASGVHRSSWCNACRKTRRSKYHSANRSRAHVRHDAWRKRCLERGGDTALRWYFTRHLSQYKARAKRLGLAIDIDADFLVDLFHKQEGVCYYTRQPLLWNTYGMGKARSEAMSLDRRDPGLGYVKENVVLCHFFVNTAKGGLTERQFVDFCGLVVKHRC